MKIISNHRIFNYTGDEIIINTKKDNKQSAIKINPSGYKDLELISDFNYECENEILNKNLKGYPNSKGFKNNNNNDKNLISNIFNKNSVLVNFILSEKKYSQNLYQDNNLSIDKNGIKQHYIIYKSDDNPLEKQLECYQYLISEITCSRLKRHICLYSPLVFHNKTRKTLILEFISKKSDYRSPSKIYESYTLIIESQAKIGIPIYYLDCLIIVNNDLTLNSEYDINNNNSNNENKFRKDSMIDTNDIMTKNFYFHEIKLSNFILNFHRKQNKSIGSLREIKINNAYSVKNYLPFEITIHSKSLVNSITLQKSEKVSIDSLSFNKPFEVMLFISDFSTKDPIVIQPFNDFEHVNRLHLESDKIELDNYSNLMKQKFAQNSNSNLPNNLKTIKLYHKNYNQNNLTIEVSALIYFKYTNFHIELVFLSTNIIVNETGLDNLRLFYSANREIGMPICFNKNQSDTDNPIIDNNYKDINVSNGKCIYRIFNNSESKFFMNVFDCTSNKINIIDDIKPTQPIIVVCKGKNKHYEFVVSVNYTYVTSEMRKTDNQVDLLCKVITIKPRTIIINELEMFSVDICLEKDLYSNDKLTRQRFVPNSKNSFYFFNDISSLNNSLCVKIEPFLSLENDINKHTKITPEEININNNIQDLYTENNYSSGLIYNWSRPILMRYHGLITIPITYDYLDFNNVDSILPNKNLDKINKENKKKQKYYLNLDIKYVDLNMIVTFSEATYENTQFLLENNLENILVRVFQYKYEGINDEIIQPKNYVYVAKNEYEKFYEDQNKKFNKTIFSLIDYLNSSGTASNCIGIEFYKYENKNKILDNLMTTDFSNCNLEKLSNSIFYYSIYENKIHNYSNGKTYEYPIIDEVSINGNQILIFIETKGMKKTIIFESKKKEIAETLSNQVLNTSITFQVELTIKNIGISLISDNIYHDRKHRNYLRNEILFILLSEINFYFKKDSKLSLNYDEGEMRLSLGNLRIDNMASTHDKCRFPNLLTIVDDNLDENYNNPFFDLSVFSQIHVFDKISKITFLNYYIKTIKISFDTDLIEEIIFFANNITFRLQNSFIEVHKIFKEANYLSSEYGDYTNQSKNVNLNKNNTKTNISNNVSSLNYSKSLNKNYNFNLLKEQRQKITLSDINERNMISYSDKKQNKKIGKNLIENNLINNYEITFNNLNESDKTINKKTASMNSNINNIRSTKHDQKHVKQYVYYFNTLEISNLKIILSMSSRNIQCFLNKYLNLGGFISNMISHIMKSDENKINLKGAKIENYSGTIKETISTIIKCYSQSSFKVFLGLSAKGLFEGFLNLFKTDAFDYKNNYLLRTRIPRPLYGNFFYIKKYDTTDALVLDLINNRKLKIHENFDSKSMRYLKCEKLIDDIDREYYFIMTTKNLIIYSKTKESCVDILEYIFIENCNVFQDNILYIKFNQDIDGVESILFDYEQIIIFN